MKKTSHDLIVEMFQRSAFGLTFETEEILGYRLQGEKLRALSIDLEKQTVEYEIREKGMPAQRRVEYSPSLHQLVEKLPLTPGAFDLKFQGLRLAEKGVPLQERKLLHTHLHNDDPWDAASCFGTPPVRKTGTATGLRLSDE